MGGDFAPQNPIQGALEAAREGIPITVVGKEAMIAPYLQGLSLPQGFQTHWCDEVVSMEDSPLAPLRSKPRSSIRVCGELVKKREAMAVVTAGNTGAAMVVGKMIIGTVRGVDRPPLAAFLPSKKGYTLILDVGANVDCRPKHLLQFAWMGAIYVQHLLGIAQPVVGLLSNGEEETKGTRLIKEAHGLLKKTQLNFLGNVEGRDIFTQELDVVVTDGFTGNVLLKAAEGLGEMVGVLLKKEIKRSLPATFGYLLSRQAFRRFQKRVDYSEYGGAPMLGLQGLMVICHGRSSPRAIKRAITVAYQLLEKGLHHHLEERMKEFSLLEKLHIPSWKSHES